MAIPPFRLRDELIDEPLKESPNQVELFSDSDFMSSGYTPDPSPPREEPMVENFEVFTSRYEPQTDKEKILGDTGKEQIH